MSVAILEKLAGSNVDLVVDSLHTTVQPEVPKYRVGIIGLSFIAWRAPDNHLDAYLNNPRCEVVALCDIDMDKLLHFSFVPSHQNIGTYKDYKEMVQKENLDIVSVCTPTDTHCQIVCDIAPYVKAIYCEKPMATTIDECNKMIRTCAKHNVFIQINHQRHFVTPKFRFSRDIVDTGTHVFDLLRQNFGHYIRKLDKDYIILSNGEFDVPHRINLEYVPTTTEHIFELSFSQKQMIPLGVQQIIDYLDGEILQPISSGHDGREALRLALEFKRVYEASDNR